MAKAAFLARWDEITHAVQDIVIELGGSISAEHGIGLMKRADLARVKSAVEMDLMRRIKAVARSQGHPQPGEGAVAGNSGGPIQNSASSRPKPSKRSSMPLARKACQ